jgi:heavy metal translocating P-type ATPase
MMYSISEFCYQCGLPLPNRPVSHQVSGKEVSFCCYGCLLTNGITGEKGEEGEALWILLRLGVGAFFAMNIMILSFTDYLYPFDGNAAAIINYIEMVLAIPVMLLLGLPILKNSFRWISDLTLNMDVLIVIGTFSAFVLSTYSTLKGANNVYFDTASIILVLVTVGRLLEANAKAQASNAIKDLLELSPKEAIIIRDGKEESVSIESIRRDDLVRMTPGETFPVDGEVIEGESSVDESMLTGESKPVFKEKGSEVLSGSTNLDGMLIFRVTNIGEEMFFSRFVALLEEARKVRAPMERLADRISSIFIPLAIIISALTFLFWFHETGIDSAIMNALSVLLISCPCALGIATPMAIWVSMGRMANQGIVVRTGETLEKLSHIRGIFFDKTGTITKGSLNVSSIFINPDSRLKESEVIPMIASIEFSSEHPLGKSFVRFATENGYVIPPLSEFKAYPGLGAQGKVNGRMLYTGSEKFMSKMGLTLNTVIVDHKKGPESQGKSVVFFGWDKEVKGFIGFSEELREEIIDAISDLKNQEIEVVMITGDNKYAAEAIASSIGVKTKTDLLPEDKIREIKTYTKGPSAMVGDGINDAPALMAADIGIAMGCSTDITRESADMSLLGNDIRKIAWSLRLAKKTIKTIRGNLAWAFFYNVVGIGLAVTGILKPLVAALIMIISSLFVLGNSLRIQKMKID